MKKIQFILTSLALLAAAASCMPDKLEEPAALDRDGKGTEVTFTAMAPGSTGTKTVVSETGPEILWQNQDRIMIFFGTSKYEFVTTLENSAPQAEFRGYIPGFTASLEGGESGPTHTFWAVYPSYWKDERNGESLTVMVPDRQTAVAGSYDPGALVSVACSNNLMLGFYNVCGGLKFKLSKEGIQQVEFHANGDKPLAGNATVKMDGDGFPLVSEVKDQASSIILTTPYGETFKPGTWYYLTCLPEALNQGWTLTFRSETETGVLEHPAAAEVKRSVWGVLDNPDASAAFHPENNIIWNEIRYTTTDGNKINENNVYNVNSFNEDGNEIISNTYTKDEGGRLVFKNPITRIPNSAFCNFSTLKMVQLPGTVKVIDGYAIQRDESLQEVLLSNGVESIGEYAFANNPVLERVRIPASVKELGRWAFSQTPSLSTFGDQLTSEDGRCVILRDTLRAYAPAGVTQYEIPSGIKAIDLGAFANGNELQSVVIPEGVEGIGVQAFYYCRSLETVTLPGSLKLIDEAAFYGTGLKTVSVPDNVRIGNNAFSYCRQLSSATLPTTEIGDAVFCADPKLEALYGPLASADHRLLVKDAKIIAVAPYGLTELTVPGEIRAIGRQVFYNLAGLKKITLENGVTTIENEAFAGCQDLEEVFVPASVTSIGTNVFSGCRKLSHFSGGFASTDGYCLIFPAGVLAYFAPGGPTEYIIPDGITEIGPMAFYNCSQLTSVTIPSSVVTIGESAFVSCQNLVSVNMAEGLQEIGYRAFYGCSKLATVDIPSSVVQIDEYAFNNCHSLSSVTLHEGLRVIGNRVFRNCINLTTVVIPSTVTRINDYAFDYCTNLTQVTLPEGLQEIGMYAFRDSGLQSVTIPSTVTSIGRYAFNCQNLTTATLLPATPPQSDYVVFNPNTIQAVYVLEASLDAYRNTEPWSWLGYNRYMAIVVRDQSTTEGVGEEDWN